MSEKKLIVLDGKRLLQIFMISVIMSLCLISGLINFECAGDGGEVGTGNLVLTLVYFLVWLGAAFAAGYADLHVFSVFNRVYALMTMTVSLIFAVASLIVTEINGVLAVICAVLSLFFTSPAYGIFYIAGSSAAVYIIVFASALALIFIPSSGKAVHDRRAVMRSLK